jgi:hypothetical protein
MNSFMEGFMAIFTRLAANTRKVLLCTACILANGAHAEVTRIELLSSKPFGDFARGSFLRTEIRVHGELTPGSEAMRDLAGAPLNANGRIAYTTHVTLIAPADLARGNGTLLVDIPNRKRPTAQGLFNSTRAAVMPPGDVMPGNGFLQEHGFTTVAIYWELGGTDVQLPVVAGADGQPMHVEAAALPIVRDVASFLARAKDDASGTPNPLAGRVRRTLAVGYSQSGRFLKTFLATGHNQVKGKAVFDGMFIFGAASGGVLLRTHAGAASGAGALSSFETPQIRGVVEEPWISTAELASVVADRGEALPKMFYVNTTTDYYSLRASLGRTGLGEKDVRLPDAVRMYDIAGASHVLNPGKSNCGLPYARLDWAPVLRATLLMLDQWVESNKAPPASELLPLQAPSNADGTILMGPAHLPQATVLVPVLDRDGNPVGGVRLPDIEAPLGTHAVQNPPMTFICSLSAGYRAFMQTPQERDAADSRETLAERYKERQDYVEKVRASVLALERKGFLLSEDGAVILDAAYRQQIPTAAVGR